MDAPRSLLSSIGVSVNIVAVAESTDRLGPAHEVSLELPTSGLVHVAPTRELDALNDAGVSRASGVFIDEPVDDDALWPEADRRFLGAIRVKRPSVHVSPLTWCRVRTADGLVILRDDPLDALLRSPRQDGNDADSVTDRDCDWPPDFTPMDRSRLDEIAKKVPGSTVIQHVPPGDGWHRVAWSQLSFAGGTGVTLECECDIQGVLRPKGGWHSIHAGNSCVYRTIAAYLRGLSMRSPELTPTPETLRTLLERALAGEWLGQQHGNQMWGSNLYLQEVSVLLDAPMPWDLAQRAVRDRVIGLDGAVLGRPLPVRSVPDGPIMPWDSDASTDGDWVIWWSRLDGRYQVEVVRSADSADLAELRVYDHHSDDALLSAETVPVTAGAAFGPDHGDLVEWRTTAIAVVDARSVPGSER